MKASTLKTLNKLQLSKAEFSLIINAPTSFSELLEGIAYDTSPQDNKKGKYDFILIFDVSHDALSSRVKEVADYGKHDILFWLCYPKGTGKIKSDLKREVVWEILDSIGLKAVTQIAIDDTWSALRGRPKALYQ